MAQGASSSVIRQLEALFEGGSAAGLSDHQLLERFNAAGGAPAGEAAFAALVARHGPMVLGACRELLGDYQHAEDAFQATFLVLARRARSIRDPDLLGNWLYGVAIRTARCERQQIARRRRREGGDVMRDSRGETGAGSRAPVGATVSPAERPAIALEQAEALHDEITRLPQAFRLPVVLCYFEGLTIDEVARRLRCPAGTVHSRLVRARDKLRRGLVRRGVVLPAAALSAALAPRSASASVSSLLRDSTTRAAIAFAARHTIGGGVLTAPAAALAREVLNTMLFHNLKAVSLPLLLLATLAACAGYTQNASIASARFPEDEPHGKPDAKTGRPDPRPAPERMFVTGRVLDPAGEPMAGVPVEIIGRRREPAAALKGTWSPYALMGHDRTDAAGRFGVDVVRTSSIGFLQVQAIASAPGVGLGWATPNPDAPQPTAEIRLRLEQVIRGKLIDMNGAPAGGVEIRVNSITRHDAEGRQDWAGPLPPADVLNWPRAVTTDESGHFMLANIGRDMTVYLAVRDTRFAVQSIPVRTDGRGGPREITMTLQPATIVEGRALAADTGRPIPRAIITVGSAVTPFFSGTGQRFPADYQGRFTAHVEPGTHYSIRAYPPEGQPYLIPEQRFEWTKGAIKRSMDIALPRGVLIRGKVVEKGTGRSLAGSSVQFIPSPGREDIMTDWQSIVASQDDGSFQIAVAPGKGHLLVFGPTPDYILEEIGSRELVSGRPGGFRTRAHDIITYEIEPGQGSHEVVATLRPARTVKGRVLDTQGRPVDEATILTRLNVAATSTHWMAPNGRRLARDGRFELHGLDPEQSVPVIFLDAGRQQGTTVEFSGKQAGEEPIVRLQPSGRARVRFVGPDGKPVAGFNLGFHFEILVTPGPPNLGLNKEDQSRRLADAGDLVNIDGQHYLDFPRADADGRVTLPNLVPGATYRISDPSTSDLPEKGVQVRKDFTVKPGETLDLGDVLIEKPHS